MRRRCFIACTPSFPKRLECCIHLLSPPPEADTPHLRSSSEQRDCVRRSRAYPGRCELSEKVEIPAEDEIEPPRAPAARQVPDERRRRLAVAPHDFEGVTARILDDLPSESGGLRGRTRRRFVRLRDDRYSRIAWQRFRPWPVPRLLPLACASVPIGHADYPCLQTSQTAKFVRISLAAVATYCRIWGMLARALSVIPDSPKTL